MVVLPQNAILAFIYRINYIFQSANYDEYDSYRIQTPLPTQHLFLHIYIISVLLTKNITIL